MGGKDSSQQSPPTNASYGVIPPPPILYPAQSTPISSPSTYKPPVLPVNPYTVQYPSPVPPVPRPSVVPAQATMGVYPSYNPPVAPATYPTIIPAVVPPVMPGVVPTIVPPVYPPERLVRFAPEASTQSPMGVWVPVSYNYGQKTTK